MSLPVDAVMHAIRGAPLCVTCIARAADIAPLRVLGALAEIGLQAVILDEYRRCEGCGQRHATHHAPPAAATHPIDLSGVAILVVDDHEETTDLYAGVLEHAGAIVQRATNLLDALNVVQQVEISVVVTDIAMPGGSGWDVLREVRRLDPGVPIVAVTGQLSPDARRLLDHGFSAALLKPVDPSHLVAVVARLTRPGPGA